MSAPDTNDPGAAPTPAAPTPPEAHPAPPESAALPTGSEPSAPAPPTAWRAPSDPWAHRRAEPRPLAFMWTTFLAVASGITLATLVAQGATGHDVYRPSARALFSLIGFGLAVLWPMLRLSQAPPEEPTGRAVIKDLTVLLAPTQAILWPQAMIFLANWPLPVVGACALLLAAWSVLVGAILALALDHVASVERSHPGRATGRLRAAWTILFIALVSIGPLADLPTPVPTGGPGRTSDVDIASLTSPITGVLEITSDRPWSGRAAMTLPAHWVAAWATLAAGVVTWLFTWPARRHLRRGAHGPPGGPEPSTGIQTHTQEPLQPAAENTPGPGQPEADA